MLSKLFRYLLLPLLLIILALYVAIPWWLPMAAKFSQPYTGIAVKDLQVGYPSYDGWLIQNLHGQQETTEHLTEVKLQNIQLSYQLLDLWQGILPTLNISKVTFNSQQAQANIDSLPIYLLLPQRWLQLLPEDINIERINGNISAPDTALGQAFSLAGTFKANPEKAHGVAKITTEDNKDLFFEADFANDNTIAATLFTKQQSAPVAKLTSQMRQSASALNWQGQMALNIPVMQKLLANFIPDQFALPVEQGRMVSNWQIDVPSDQQQSLQQWLAAAQGEHQFQLQIQTNTELAKDINLDANLTHKLKGQDEDEWQINIGSQLSLKPNWDYFNLQESTIDSLFLRDMEMRATAQIPVTVALKDSTDSLLGNQQKLALDGIFNATWQAPSGQYQLFTQLQDLSYSNTNNWQGEAYVSGYYVVPQKHPLLQQIPLGIQQVQGLAKLVFDMSPSTWKMTLAPKSKLSANQVESQQRQNHVLLFANDRLNLSNGEPLEIIYNTTNDEWQWNDINLSLQPQTATGTSQANSRELGLQVQLPAGRSQFSNRPSQGFYQLHARDTRLRGWPEFDLLGEGKISFGNNKIALDFAGQAQPFAPTLQAQFDWDFSSQEGALKANAKTIDLAAIQQQQQVNWPLQATKGDIDYKGQWNWQADNQKSQHQFQLNDINGAGEELQVTGLQGTIKVQPQQDKLTANYQLQATTLQPKAYAPALKWQQVNLNMGSESPLNKGLAKAMAAPENWLLNSAKGQILGGEMLWQDNQWQLSDIQLNQITQTLWPELDSQGSLSGHIKLTDDWQVDELQVKTNQGAAVNLSQAIANDQPGAETLNQLLQNLQVDALEMNSQGPQDGSKLPLSLRLQGQSPNFNDSQPVDLNLTIEANLSPWLAP